MPYSGLLRAMVSIAINRAIGSSKKKRNGQKQTSLLTQRQAAMEEYLVHACGSKD